jgi:magnesium-transporting ATPase (P-type)
VTAVGKYSTEGKISDKLKGKDNDETPLQTKLNYIASLIGNFGGWAAIWVIGVVWLRLIIEMYA